MPFQKALEKIDPDGLVGPGEICSDGTVASRGWAHVRVV
eukprot:gene2187-30217_t